MLPQLTVEKPFFNSIYQHIRNAHVVARENVSGTSKIEPRQSHHESRSNHVNPIFTFLLFRMTYFKMNHGVISWNNHAIHGRCLCSLR